MPASPAGASGPLVDEVTTAAYTVPTDAPEADGTLAWDSTTLVVVHVRSGTTTGLGYTYGAPVTAHVVDDQLSAVVVGRCALDVPAANEAMNRAVRNAGRPGLVAGALNEAMNRAVRNAGRPGLVAGALSAVDTALWDLKARLLELPLVRLLGAARPEVPVYGSGGFTTYDVRRQDHQLRGWVADQGIPRVKIKIAESWGTAESRDRRRIAQARHSIGEAAELYVDANGGYTRKQAIRLDSYLMEHQVTWFEEPVSSDDLTGLAQIRAATAVDVAAGEYGYTLPYFRQLLGAEAVDCVQADITRCGGLTVWLRVAALAQASGMEISGHCAPHLHAHAAAAVPNLRHLEWFHDHVRIENRLFHGTLDPTGGAVRPGTDGAPGHGLSLRDEEAEPYRVG
ncbi:MULTISPECIES: enolase C-terminal domain-like protein [unclassified Streptomyces]|uniref:enolase C-terminal domain-like protein n=1 Tax=unclassified Streptomyces TaxID=2593676 RepID=UPI00036E9A46|nr:MULTISPECIES: enolase C-terminal domain-like protein [unclassified Streptomyces]MYT28589.1 mandelate racemase [Streptomyces sp. SID8354]